MEAGPRQKARPNLKNNLRSKRLWRHGSNGRELVSARPLSSNLSTAGWGVGWGWGRKWEWEEKKERCQFQLRIFDKAIKIYFIIFT
jgi:hypothetical protein